MALPDAGARAASIPIIDTHIHLFDTRRPQGVPWPDKKNAILYKPALPDRYRKIAAPLGVVGAIEVEASPWLEDNQWVLDVSAKDKMIVGTVGDLEPGKPEFRKQLDRFHRNPLFLGIRYGNLWDRNIGPELAKPQFISDVKVLADASLELDGRVEPMARLHVHQPAARAGVDLEGTPERDLAAQLADRVDHLRVVGKRGVAHAGQHHPTVVVAGDE